MKEFLELIEGHLAQERKEQLPESGSSSPPGLCHIVTINPEIAWLAQSNQLMEQAIQQAHLIVPDGIGVVLAARLKGGKVPQRVAGFDLMQEMLKLAADQSYTVFFLGAAPGIAEAAAATAVENNPGLQVVGTNHGYFKAEEEEGVIQKIAALKVDMLFCALGNPRPAETWIFNHKQELQAGVAMGVGGSFDVMAGKVLRAPLWMQKIGLEWLYRVWREPKRIRRLAAIPKFMWKVFISQ